jgi:UDP-MurNAc hydroxylase
MRVTYYGQACTLIEAGGRRILTDPWLTDGAYFGTWFHTHVLADAGVTPETFPKDIDYLFLSHEHRDHLDVASLRHFRRNTSLLVCKFSTPKFLNYLESLGFSNIIELPSGKTLDAGEGLKLTILGTAEYTNDSALLVEHEGCRLFQETDCKLKYGDLAAIGERGIDIGFYMFSGANWYPMLYNYPADVQCDLVRRRRRALLNSFVQRVKLTRPRIAVPSAGPCTVLDPDMLWMNSDQRGIFVDPAVAVQVLRDAKISVEPLLMMATDAWDSRTGFESNSPALFHTPRERYIAEASERMAPSIARARTAEAPADSRLPSQLAKYFNELVGAQTPAVRARIGARLALDVTGPQGGQWTVDFTSSGPEFVQEGLSLEWTYKIRVEDKLLWPFISGQEPFFEDLLLSLRFRADRNPDVYNEPLYHFLYEPDPEKLHNWYAEH